MPTTIDAITHVLGSATAPRHTATGVTQMMWKIPTTGYTDALHTALQGVRQTIHWSALERTGHVWVNPTERTIVQTTDRHAILWQHQRFGQFLHAAKYWQTQAGWNIPPRALLILGCSAQKRPDPQPLPAVQRYDGPAWRTLRAAQASFPILADEQRLAVYALSAEYGLFPAIQPIPDYDRPLDVERAAELAPFVEREIAVAATIFQPIASAFVLTGGRYTRLLAETTAFRDGQPAFDPIVPSGGIGQRLQHLKAWLTTTAQLLSA